VIAVELQRGVPVVVLDREDRLEDRLQPVLVAPLGRDLLLEKLLVGLLLDLDEVRDLDDRRDLAEVFAAAAPTLNSACHTLSSIGRGYRPIRGLFLGIAAARPPPVRVRAPRETRLTT
jgi:hypothetical protein